jgi:hypothetical protein
VRSVKAAIAFEFHRRHRLGVYAVAFYLVALAAIKAYIVSRGIAVHFEDPEQFAIVVVVPMTILFVYSLAVFTHGFAGDVAGRQSVYPARMFTLPATNSELAGWPMLYGCVTLVVLWYATRVFVIWPPNIAIPYIWPGVLAAVLMSWAQALVWMPYGFTGARIIAAVVWLTAIDSVVMYGVYFHPPEWLVTLLLVPLLPLAFLTARYAVARARQGVIPAWSLWPRTESAENRTAAASSAVSGGRGRFRSAAAAHAWFEFRESGLTLPAIVALLLPFELLMLKVAGDTVLVVEILLLTVVTPPFMAAFVGASIRKPASSSRDEYGLNSFLATRPLTSAALIGAKLRVSVWSTLITWAIVLFAIPLGVRWTGATPAVIQRWERVVRFMGEPRAIVFIAFIVLLFMLTTWRQLVQALYVSVSGRDWLMKTYVGLTLAAVSLLGPVLEWLVKSRNLLHYFWDILPVILAGLAVIKFALAVWLAIRLYHSTLLRDRTLVLGAAIWCVAVLAIYALMRWWLDTDLFPRHIMMLAAILIVPLIRPSAAPLALAWNRHR